MIHKENDDRQSSCDSALFWTVTSISLEGTTASTFREESYISGTDVGINTHNQPIIRPDQFQDVTN